MVFLLSQPVAMAFIKEYFYPDIFELLARQTIIGEYVRKYSV